MKQGTDKDTTKRCALGAVWLSDAGLVLREALEQLVQAPEANACFVMAYDRVTCRFVQFLGSDKSGTVTIDQPSPSLDQAGLKRIADLLPEAYPFENYICFQKRACSPEEGARLGMQILREVHMLPEFAEIKITFESSQRQRPS
jgi:hypothetical protein